MPLEGLGMVAAPAVQAQTVCILRTVTDSILVHVTDYITDLSFNLTWSAK